MKKGIIKQNRYATVRNLVFSIIIDFVGMTSYFFPFIGEIFDIIWAPISAVIVYLMYKNYAFATGNLIEELFPFTDIVPTATIAWIYCKVNRT
ncbi:MAG: hypothetical protein WCI72_05510 [archaeon]